MIDVSFRISTLLDLLSRHHQSDHHLHITVDVLLSYLWFLSLCQVKSMYVGIYVVSPC